MAKLARVVKCPIENLHGRLKSRLKGLFMSTLRKGPPPPLFFICALSAFALPAALFETRAGAQATEAAAQKNSAAKNSAESAGGGFFLAPLPSFALGLHYEHANTGSDRFVGQGVNSQHMERGMHTLFIDVRLHPLRRPSVALTVDLGLGFGWQYASAASASDIGGLGRNLKISFCDAHDTKALGFRAGLGAEIPLRGRLYANAQASIATMRFSYALIENCAPGAGTTNALTLRAGFLYRFDMSEVFSNR
jgi:hypothetical protein